MATVINNEVEPIGGFVGDAFITPVFLGGQALTALFFIVAQSFVARRHRRAHRGDVRP